MLTKETVQTVSVYFALNGTALKRGVNEIQNRSNVLSAIIDSQSDFGRALIRSRFS